jgi:CRP/FNR family transcriptional regulator, anaerobic regulatory protein
MPTSCEGLLHIGRGILSERFAAGASRVLRAGQLLAAGANPQETLYRLRAGWAYRFRKFKDGTHAIVEVYLPGDIIAIRDKDASCIRTLTTAAVEVIVQEDGLLGLMASPDIGVCLYQLLSDQQQRGDARLASIASLPAQGRMAAMILDFYIRLERQKLVLASSFHMPMTQYHIGSFLGITAVHVNRVIGLLRDSEIVNIEKHHATILNLSKLAELANIDVAIPRDHSLAAPADRVGEVAGEHVRR